MTDEVALRDVRESDLPVFFEQQSDPEATRVAAFPCRAHAEFMAHWAKILAGEAVLVKTIIFRGNVAGNIVAWEQSGELKIGYWLGREYWGKGIATAALSEFLLQAKVRPLYARVAKHNRASIRVLQKCGFTVAGEDKFRDINGGESEEFIFKLEADRGYEPDATADQPRE